jgi:hypothetical protein
MSHGATNWPFLMLTGAAGFAGGHQQVGLTAKKRGNLQHVHGFGGDFAVRGLVHVGQHRQARVFGNAAKDARTLQSGRGRESSSRWCDWPCRSWL